MLSRKRIAIVILPLLLILLGCDSENAFDCIQADGDTVNITLDLPEFSRIQFEDDIRVELQQGPVQEVILETGENLVSDLNIFVQGDLLIAQNDNGCNIFREFGVTVLKITSPNISYVRNASAFEIRSIGTLSYPSLRLESTVSGNLDDPNKVGDFFIDVDTQNIEAVANGMSRFFLSGQSDQASFLFSDEFPLLEAQNLIVQDILIRQVSAATMRLHPVQSIRGEIRGVGDVIAFNQPPMIDVVEFSEGQLIFD